MIMQEHVQQLRCEVPIAHDSNSPVDDQTTKTPVDDQTTKTPVTTKTKKNKKNSLKPKKKVMCI